MELSPASVESLQPMCTQKHPSNKTLSNYPEQ